MMRTIERRIAGAELRADQDDDGMVTVTGLAAATNKPYVLWSSMGGEYREEIVRGAFKTTLAAGADVSLLVEHRGLPLARTTNATMRMWESSRGLEIEARMDSSDPDVAALVPKMRAGSVNEMSISFVVSENGEDWEEGTGYVTRKISELDMDRLDVSVVRAGANPNTEVNLRSIMDTMKTEGTDMAPSADGQVFSANEAEQLDLPTVVAETISQLEDSKAGDDTAKVKTDGSEANPTVDQDDSDLDLRLELLEKTGALV